MQEQRSQYHLTLGQLIAILKPKRHEDIMVPLGEPFSYRGFYEDLAFPRGETPIEKFVALCEASVGKVFSGYKGGSFPMHEDTPLWLAEWGDTGNPITHVSQKSGSVQIHTRDLAE